MNVGDSFFNFLIYIYFQLNIDKVKATQQDGFKEQMRE